MFGSRWARLLGSTVGYISAQLTGSHPGALKRAHEFSGESLSWPALRLFEKGDAAYLPSVVAATIDFLRSCPAQGVGSDGIRQIDFLSFFAEHRAEMASQLGQDLMVMFFLGSKRDGFFVEIGAGDGQTFSNTYMLEKTLGWRGILAEPNPVFHASIQAKRTARLEKRAVYSAGGQSMRFAMVEGAPELSTLTQFAAGDEHDRTNCRLIDVETTTVEGLLEKNGAPRQVDYMSIDTEGSEYEILRSLDFNRRDVSIFSIEHNNASAKRALIDELLLKRGYAGVFPLISKWDGWYVKSDLLHAE